MSSLKEITSIGLLAISVLLAALFRNTKAKYEKVKEEKESMEKELHSHEVKEVRKKEVKKNEEVIDRIPTDDIDRVLADKGLLRERDGSGGL